MIPLTLLFFLEIAMAIWDLLWFQVNFGITYSSSVKNPIGSLIGIALNEGITLGSMDILMMLILPIH